MAFVEAFVEDIAVAGSYHSLLVLHVEDIAAAVVVQAHRHCHDSFAAALEVGRLASLLERIERCSSDHYCQLWLIAAAVVGPEAHKMCSLCHEHHSSAAALGLVHSIDLAVVDAEA